MFISKVRWFKERFAFLLLRALSFSAEKLVRYEPVNPIPDERNMKPKRKLYVLVQMYIIKWIKVNFCAWKKISENKPQCVF